MTWEVLWICSPFRWLVLISRSPLLCAMLSTQWIPCDGNTEAAVMLFTLMETGFAPGGKDATFYLGEKKNHLFSRFFTRLKIWKILCAAFEIEKFKRCPGIMLGDIPEEEIGKKGQKIEFEEEKPGQTLHQKRLAENVHSRSKDKCTVQSEANSLCNISHTILTVEEIFF